MSKKDALLAAIIGLVIAVILLLIGANIALTIPFGGTLILIFPILSVAGLWLSSLIARRIFIVWQAAKFFLVGVLNTFIDLGVLNLFIFLSGVASGSLFSVFKGIGFVIAVVNSYYWNKIWTFGARQGGFISFFLVSAVGLLINVGVASLVVNVIGPPPTVAPSAWANIGGLIATLIALVWNFVGYKFIVFKK